MTFTATRRFSEAGNLSERSTFRKGPEVDPFAEILGARMDLIIHGVPRDRRARRQMRELLGEIDPVNTNNNYDPHRWKGSQRR